MKSLIRKPNPDLLAYPLSTLHLPEEVQKKPFRLLKKLNKITRHSFSSKVLRLVQTATATDEQNKTVLAQPSPDHIEVQDTDWYVNYE